MPAAVISDKFSLPYEFPGNVSVNDLCDCGRHRCQHKTVQQEHRAPFPESDYMSTYRAIDNPKPRSSKRPHMQVRETRFAPMMLSTSQREDFKNPGQVERTLPVIHITVGTISSMTLRWLLNEGTEHVWECPQCSDDARYESPKQALEQVTSYSQEFTQKQMQSEPVIHTTSRRDQLHDESAKFEDRTTNKEHFKRWLPQPQMTFGELPSFIGSLLFPGKDSLPVSTTRQTYTQVYAPPAALAKAVPGSLKLEGIHTFDTTHNATYRKIEGDHRVKPLVQTDHNSIKRDNQFLGISQTQQDFPGFKGRQPCPPKPVDPPQTTIDFKCDNRQIFDTENRTVFQGHDVMKHPAPDSCKKGSDEFKVPSVKLETETSHQRDYQLIDVTNVENIRKKIPQTSLEIAAQDRFDGKTTNNEFFHKWKVQPRVRYGDFHASKPYLPPQQPFNGNTVTKSVYVAQPTSPVRIHRQRQQPVHKEGKMTFETEYQQEFQKKQRRLCPAAVFLMQQEMKRATAEPSPPQQLKNKCTTSSQTTHLMAPETRVKG